MKLITATEIMEQIQLLSESPANSKNERAINLRDIKDCARRLLDGEDAPAVKESLTTENKEPTTAELVKFLRDQANYHCGIGKGAMSADFAMFDAAADKLEQFDKCISMWKSIVKRIGDNIIKFRLVRR